MWRGENPNGDGSIKRTDPEKFCSVLEMETADRIAMCGGYFLKRLMVVGVVDDDGFIKPRAE